MKAGYSLSDCVNYTTNERGDCGGRVTLVKGRVLCETCRNRATESSTVQSD